MPDCSYSARFAELISCGRRLAMGAAIVCILLFHQEFIAADALYPISFYGYWGVEVFLFVSGFGIWFALSKHRGKVDKAAFYKRRALRVMPTAIMAGSIIAVGNAFTQNAFISGSLPYGLAYVACALGVHLWYIRAILVFYLLAPFVYPLISRRLYLILFIIVPLAAGMLLCQVPGALAAQNVVKSVIWPLLRFPAFIAGMYVAYLGTCGGQESSPLSLPAVLGCSAVAIISLAAAVYMKNSSLYALQYTALLPCAGVFCLLCGWLRQSAAHCRLIGMLCAAGEWLGTHSLEIYLVHLAVYYGMRKYYAPTGAAAFILSVVLSLLLACLLRKAAGVVVRLLPVAR